MERKIIKIVDVDGSPKKYAEGKKELWKFRALADGEQFEFTIFNKDFVKPITDAVGEGLDCEWEVKPSKSGDFTNRTLTQIYIDGKPMTEKKAFAGGGYRESPEARLSIETQVSVKAVVDLAIAGKLPDEWGYLLTGAMLWCDKRLNPTGIIPDKPTKPITATPQPLKQAIGSPSPKPVETPVPDEKIPQNIGELYTSYLSHFSPEDRRKINAKTDIANFKPTIDLKDIPKAWREIKARSNWQ